MQKLSIILVDDNIRFAEEIAQDLGAGGHTVSVVGSASSALELLRRQTPDLLIVDWYLPVSEGSDPCEEGATDVLTHLLSARIPKIVQTGASPSHVRDVLGDLKCLIVSKTNPITADKLDFWLTDELFREDLGLDGLALKTETIEISPILDGLNDQERFIVDAVLHDLQNILGLTGSHIQRVIDSLKAGNAKKAEDVLARLPSLPKEAVYYTTLLYDLLLGRCVCLVPVDLRDAIAEGVNLAARFKAPGARLHLFVPTVPVIMMGDVGLLSHVIMNLLRNAYEATTDDALVALACSFAGAIPVVRVGNGGKPIPDPQKLAEWGCTSKGTVGRGIGLTLVHEVIRRLGGRMSYARNEAVLGRIYANVFELDFMLQGKGDG